MKNTTTYNGFVQRAPADTNPKNESNRFLFSGVAVSNHEDFACEFRAIRLHGFTSPEQFGLDVDASDGSLPGTLELFEPDRSLGRFKYYRPDGSGSATADITGGREYRFCPEKPRDEPNDEEPMRTGRPRGPLPPLPTPKFKDLSPGGFD